MDIRTCTECHKTFWEDEMSVGKSTCRSCEASIKMEWRHNNTERHRKYKRDLYAKDITATRNQHRLYRFINPEKKSASNKVSCAKLEKQPCEVCGSLNTQAHHDNYSKPLEVRWLCQLHHSRIHMEA